MRRAYLTVFTSFTGLICAGSAHAVWTTPGGNLAFSDQSVTRLVADPSVGSADKEERDYAVGDFDQDGWVDLFVARKIPYSLPGGKREVLLMNENGVLTDRTATLGSASTVAGGQGMLDLTNTRDAAAVDVNNDGWLDIVTAATISDGLAKHIGHPRVYMNLGKVAGVWQGFRHEDARIAQLVTISGLTNQNPRFCGLSAGDVTGDGYVDLFFNDYDTGEVGPAESPANDFNARLLINQGAANPGFFTDESLARMGPTFTSSWLSSTFGLDSVTADFNGDGQNDIIRINTLTGSIHVGAAYNTAAGTGIFTTQPYNVLSGAGNDPYAIETADLNHDGRMDLVIANDANDRYAINTGTTLVGGFPVATWSFTSLGTISNGFPGEITIVDLNNDGWEDFIISDADEDTYYSSGGDSANRKTHLYRSNGGASFTNDDSLFTQPQRRMIHDVAALDINNDCWVDLVFFQSFTDVPVGGETGSTIVYISNAPGGSACPPPPPVCPTDVNGNGCTNGSDIACILGVWTGASTYAGCSVGPGPYTAMDLNQDCRHNGLDVAIVLGGWGACPGGSCPGAALPCP